MKVNPVGYTVQVFKKKLHFIQDEKRNVNEQIQETMAYKVTISEEALRLMGEVNDEQYST